MTMLLCLLLIAAVATGIALPLYRPASGSGATTRTDATTDLERRKRVAMLAIREAEFDHELGKLSEEDYRSLTSAYETRALEAMGAIEAIASVAPATPGGSNRPDDDDPAS